MYSVQRVVSDGTLQIVDLSITYFDRSEIAVYINSELYTAWQWASDVEDRIIFNKPVPAGIEVLIKRTTDLSKLRHYFSKGSAFTAEALDEDLQQVLHIAQEATEASLSGDFYTDIDMHGYRVRNIGPAVDDSDALTLRQYKQDVQGAFVARNQAEQFKNEAASYASSAQTSANNSAASAQDSLAAAGNAKTYAASAAASANAAEQSATNAAASAASAAQSATNAAASVSAVAQSATNAAASASAAAQSKANATASAASAAQSEANATASAASAAQSAANAAASASAAAQSEANAAASASAAAASFDAFDDRYLGSKASDPTTDNDGNALQVGALYWNTTANEMRVWNGSSWRVAAGSLVGNADTATKLQTARTLTIGNTGKSFDGSADVSWSLAEIGATNANGDYIVRDTRNVDTPTNMGDRGVRYEFKSNATDGLNDGGTYHAVMTFQQWYDSTGGYTHQLGFTGNGNLWLRAALVGGTWGPWRRFFHSGNINTANAGTATKLQTARTITIGNTGKSFDGSANVSWSLDEIGVTAFGLGGAAASVPGNNIDAPSIPTGFYYVNTTTSGTKPAGDDGFGHLIVSREGPDGLTARQLYLDNTTNRIWTRGWSPSQWSGWVEIYHSGNINTANAGTATKLQTARTITIGNTGKSFDGSANVSWSLAEVVGVGAPGTAQELGGGVDLNTIQTPGFYFQLLDDRAASGTNYPIAQAGSLVVLRNVGLTQLYYAYGGGTSPRAFFRTFYSYLGQWSPWREIYHSGNLGAASEAASGIVKLATAAEAQAGTDDTKMMTPLKTAQAIAKQTSIYGPVGLVQVQTGGGVGFYQRVDGNFNPLLVGRSAFHAHPIYRGIVEQIIDGQWMVRIPKFYFRSGTVPSGTYAGKTYWMISDQPAPGFSVHPAFIGPGGVELAQIWVGKYQASSSGGKLQSVPGVLPRVSMNFPTARAEAYARNTGGVTGFRLWSVYDLSAIQMLASIEMGGLDMQSLIGQGRVSASSAANVDASDVAQATWRGIVGLWGNVWQMVDGLKRNGGNWWRWQYNVPGNTTTSDFATGYVDTGRSALTASGYPVTFDTTLLAAGVIVPETVDGAQSNGSTGDYFYSDTGTDDRIAFHGGSWADGAPAGLFSLTVRGTLSFANSSFGTRLAKV